MSRTFARVVFPKRRIPPRPPPVHMTAIVESISELRRRLSGESGLVGLVPTMGALHEGHARLITAACAECDVVVVSIFVNPIQFDRPADLEQYPRAPGQDRELCERLGVDFIFMPTAAEMYPTPPACTVDVERITDHLCGQFR